MKEYCVDLKIAKELKENGFSQTTKYYHRIQRDGIGEFTDFSDTNLKSDFMTIVNIYSAPCSDEILKELPNEINGYVLEIIRYEDGTIEADYIRNLQYEDDKEYLINSKKLFYKSSDSLADLWLDLKKEGYIK